MIAALDKLIGSPTRVALLLALFLGLHASITLVAGLAHPPAALGMDDAEQAMFAQQFSWSYRFQQPPLFTWILNALAHLGPVNIVSLTLLRYALLAALFILMWRLGQLWLDDPRAAALATLSLAAIYIFGYYAHHDLTHSTILATTVAASLLVFARIERSPSWANYGALGVCFGLGMLSKWNFLILALALPATALAFPRTRALVLTTKSLLAAAIAAAIALPSIFWVLSQRHDFKALSREVLAERHESSGLGTALTTGSLDLLEAVIAFPQPWAALFLLAFGLALWRGPVTWSPRARFLALFIAIGIGLHALLLIVLQAATFSERWMITVLMPLPLLGFVLIDAIGLPRTGARLFVGLCVCAMMLSLGFRAWAYVAGADACGKCRLHGPFDDLKDQLLRVGYRDSGTIVTEQFYVGGNLRVWFPESRIRSPLYPTSVWPPARPDQPCLLAWENREPDPSPMPASLEAYIAQAAFDRNQLEIGEVRSLMHGSAQKTFALGYALLRPEQGSCP
ncbi:MAG: glycosyltransferase family 39 protein [Geminicoccaceae bacterium]